MCFDAGDVSPGAGTAAEVPGPGPSLSQYFVHMLQVFLFLGNHLIFKFSFLCVVLLSFHL